MSQRSLSLSLAIALAISCAGNLCWALGSESPEQSLRELRDMSRDPSSLTVTDCAGRLNAWTTSAKTITAEDLSRASHASAVDRFLADLFKTRLAFRARWETLAAEMREIHVTSAACVQASRRVFEQLRSFEDLVALESAPPAFIAANPTSLQGEAPWLLKSQSGSVRLRSGDVLLSRGNAYVSAAIARIGVDEGQFSHLTQIYIDAPAGTEVAIEDAAQDPRVFTIEAHIEVGSFTRPFIDYVKDGNARVVQFRPREDAETAHRAAAAIFNYVRSYQAAKRAAAHRTTASVNDNPPYDFKMDSVKHDEIFCAEIVSIAQEAVGLKVPAFPSVLKRNDVTRRLGITATSTFAPSDIELDDRFELLAEWRDLSKLADIRQKDSVFHAIYRWMSEHDVAFHTSATDDSKALFAWSVRQTDAGFLDRMPKNMSRSMIAMTFVIDRVGTALQKRVQAFQAAYAAEHAGLRPMYEEEDADLEAYRNEDIGRFNAGRKSDFQWDLR